MTVRKQRSPKYPSRDLETSIEFVRKVWEACRDTDVDRPTVAELLNLSPSSGSALQTTATLILYGLLEKRAKNVVGVSDLAKRVLFADSRASVPVRYLRLRASRKSSNS